MTSRSQIQHQVKSWQVFNPFISAMLEPILIIFSVIIDNVTMNHCAKPGPD